MTEKPNIVIRFLKSIWNVVDGTRRLVLNLIFWPIFIYVLILLFRDDGLKVEDRTTLVLAPEGFIVEQYSANPRQRVINSLMDNDTPETQLRDILKALETARDDDRITQVLIRPDYLYGAGLSKLQEIRSAMQSLRESGKRIIAYSEGMSQHQYYLASLADEIWMHPEGLVILEGYGVYRNFYKEGLDKLAVDVHLFRVGEYKSAAEPYVRNDMSPESKEANLFWISSLWQDYLQQVADNRGMPASELEQTINGFAERMRAAGGNAADMALSSRLVDRIGTRDELKDYLAGEGSLDKDDHLRSIGMHGYLTASAPLIERPDQKKVAVIVAQGTIVSGNQSQGTIGGESTSRLIRRAREDDNVSAIVLRVDSGGGAVLPSEKIRHEIELTREEGKPVVVSMSSVAASGGYWVSLSANEVWANPTTITGSIGIFGLFTTFPKTLEKVGIRTDGVGTTPLAGALRPDRPLADEVGEIIQAIIDNGYENFISKVAESRQMTVEAVDEIARGRVWSGSQAHERGLIDHLGGLDKAIASAASLADLGEDYRVSYVEQPVSALDRFLLDMTASVDASIDFSTEPGMMQRLFGNSSLTAMRSDLELLLNEPSDRLGIYAYCFCTIE